MGSLPRIDWDIYDWRAHWDQERAAYEERLRVLEIDLANRQGQVDRLLAQSRRLRDEHALIEESRTALEAAISDLATTLQEEEAQAAALRSDTSTLLTAKDALEQEIGSLQRELEQLRQRTAKEKAGVLSFVLEGVHAHDIGTILDRDGIAIRAGHHCTMPLMQRFGVPATARASLAFYNTRAELDALGGAIPKAIEMFR